MKTVSVLGGGLVGPMMALLLAKRNIKVNIFEKRPNPFQHYSKSGRTVNLALSERGWRALKKINISQKVTDIIVPLSGRMVHLPDGEQLYQPYGINQECIYSVSREELNKILIQEAQKHENITFYFEKECQNVFLENSTLQMVDCKTKDISYFESDLIIGADGISSQIRKAIGEYEVMDFERNYIDYGYKELSIPAIENNQWAIEKNVLHIWPRGRYMLMALPNNDGSFTATLYAPLQGENSFEQIDTAGKLITFFQKDFPDVTKFMPHLEYEFFNFPVSSLSSINCYPWVHKSRALIIGDAAHAILPFYGQGMNSGFEDCTYLDALLDHNEINEKTLDIFQKERKANADALSILSYNNFLEMRDYIKNPLFLLRKKIDFFIGENYPDIWQPIYTLIAFRTTPYQEVLRISLLQNEILDKIMMVDDIENCWMTLDYSYFLEEITAYV
ncbi:MAG: FAD-dependent monooxygenase [Arcicella sp.]|jgi:kynurenine 3-monooxygenase|nr:FAD-dependent monooxygenase [Arcicella sp.]